MHRKSVPVPARVVIVVPPTDHYRIYTIEGDIRKCTSKPLRPEGAENTTPCGPKCPMKKYAQFTSDSGIVQHYPTLSSPEEPVDDKTEHRRQAVGQCKSNLENTRRDSNVSAKRRTGGIPGSVKGKRKPAFGANLGGSRKTLSSGASAKKAPTFLKYKDPKLNESYVVLEQLDLPINCKTVRLVQIDKRLKEELDNRFVVETSKGERRISPLTDSDRSPGSETSPLRHKQRFPKSPQQGSCGKYGTGAKPSSSESKTSPLFGGPKPAKLKKSEPPIVNVIDEDASDSVVDSEAAGALQRSDVGDEGSFQEEASPTAPKVSDRTVSNVTPFRASVIRKSLSIVGLKPKLKRRSPKVSVVSLKKSPSDARKSGEGAKDPSDRSEAQNGAVSDESSSSMETQYSQGNDAVASSSNIGGESVSGERDLVKEDNVTCQYQKKRSQGDVTRWRNGTGSVEKELDSTRLSRRKAEVPAHLKDFLTVLPKTRKATS